MYDITINYAIKLNNKRRLCISYRHTIWGYVNTAIFALIFILVGCPTPPNYNKASGASTNPNIWTQETASADWSARRLHTAVVFNDKLWVLGGGDKSVYYNDVWSSVDGKEWTQETDASWSNRMDHAAVVFNDKLWVLGGYDDESKNDVWSYGLP